MNSGDDRNKNIENCRGPAEAKRHSARLESRRNHLGLMGCIKLKMIFKILEVHQTKLCICL